MRTGNGRLVRTAEAIWLTLDDTSREVTINPAHYPHIDHGYATTIHKSQGATVDHAYVLASRTLDAPLTYVAMTRHRERLVLFINSKDTPVWTANVRNQHKTHRQAPNQSHTPNRSR